MTANCALCSTEFCPLQHVHFDDFTCTSDTHSQKVGRLTELGHVEAGKQWLLTGKKACSPAGAQVTEKIHSGDRGVARLESVGKMET